MHSQEKINGDFGEAVVNTLAFDTYLRYWCYPGPKDELGSKKEICDLLILFRNTMIILSVKNYSFKGNYERYFRLTLDKAISQISGAERKLLNSTDLVIKHNDLGDQKFDPLKYSSVHRIIVNHNAEPLFYPAGKLNNDKFIHIFNWDAFFGVVNELDTIPDLIQYLIEREHVLKDTNVTLMSGKEDDWDHEVQKSFIDYCITQNKIGENFLLLSGNELDFLADYLWNGRKFNSLLYDRKFNGGSFELDGKWERYLIKQEVVNKKIADQESYFVDEFVKREVLYSQKPSNLEIAVELLSLSRFERRIVGSEFLAFMTQNRNIGPRSIVRRYGKVQDLLIAFISYSRDMPHEMVMKLIKLAAEGYAYFNRYQDKKIVMIAVSQDAIGFKFGMMKVEPFSPELEAHVISDLKLLKWFTKVDAFQVTHNEYPD
jgi:hypothetical protein